MISKQQSECYYLELLCDSCYRQKLEKIARKYTRGTGLSWEDAVQAAHLKVLQVIQDAKFRQGGIEQFFAWVVVVTKYEILDFVRKESLRNCQSLDCSIPGTDITLLDTIPDEFNTLEATERADLVVKAIEAIYQLHQSHPQQQYLQLWLEKVDGKTQTQIAAKLGVSQSEISKRWQELVGRIAQMLGLLEFEDVKQQNQKLHQQNKRRDRSTQQW
ncbi:MAG: sigma-70 family RNA polymerase sigma factor [Desmonostoc vinosum HA7617-LM4]|jgi:RNA polymerase sporulation-specific sigma factor|nr:sigma-70 family RNA polymerase sigma factor [Desmonostoc vinosum HA7617-LM4]